MSTLVERHAGRHPSVMEALRWLDCGHLPDNLRAVSDVITTATETLIMMLKDGPQLVKGLHALIEAKDCMVRQAIRDHESTVKN